VHIKGWSEHTALERVHAWLVALNRQHAQLREGQPTPCEQIIDLLARFPEQKEWTTNASCGSGPGGPVSPTGRT
jgi:hypothetical protein